MNVPHAERGLDAARPTESPHPASESWALARLCADTAWKLRARQITVLDVRAQTPLADFFVLATGQSARQVQSVAQEIARQGKTEHRGGLGIEGLSGGRWALVDLGDVVVHVFAHELRRHFDLEMLWGDAPAFTWQDDDEAPPPEAELEDAALPYAGFLADLSAHLADDDAQATDFRGADDAEDAFPVDPVLRRVVEVGQGHVLRWWSDLDDQGRDRLRRQLAAVDFDLVARLKAQITAESAPGERRFEPLAIETLAHDDESRARDDQARALGWELLRQGKVALFLVAGGQATRLGVEGPKGCYPIAPLSGRTLFALFARQILGLTRHLGRALPWYVMTGPDNHDETLAYFEAHGHFGLPPDDLRVFVQATVPALDDDGRMILQAPDRVLENPDGHGGSLLALARSGALSDMRARGIEEIFYFQVDNPLALVADPRFVGLHRLRGAEMSTKVVGKTDPQERVGILGRIDGAPGVIEYSEFSDEERHRRDPDGRLCFRAGNVAIHMLRRDFVERLTADPGFELPFHRARKEVMALGADGGVEMRVVNKFERFVFDALAGTAVTVVQEVERAEEFAPVKNADGADSPESARRALIARARRWCSALDLPAPEVVEIDGALAPTEEIWREHCRRRRDAIRQELSAPRVLLEARED